MKGKKLFALITTVAVMASVFAGCGSSSSSNDSSDSSKGTVVKLVYARGKDTTPGTRKIVEAFNKKYKGKIQVQYLQMPSDSDKQHDQYVTVFSSGGTDYDVIDADVVWPAEFAQAGYALPLDKYIQRDNVNLKDYMDGSVKSVTFKGKTWALPRYIDAGLLFYRKDLVKQVPGTWEDLAAQSEQLKGKTNFSYVAQGKQYEGLVCNAVEFIAAYGGQIVDGDGNIIINSQGTKQGLEMMKKIYSSNYVPDNITTFTETESCNAFIQGQSTFIRNWPYQWGMAQDKSQSKIAGNVAVAPLPKGSVRSASCLGGWTAMINKNTKHPEEAWKFLKFLAGPEGQKIAAVDGSLAPTLTNLYKDTEVAKASPLFSDQNFINGLSAAVPRPVSPIYAKLSNIMQFEISAYLSGKEDVDAAIKNMDKKMKDAVNSSNK